MQKSSIDGNVSRSNSAFYDSHPMTIIKSYIFALLTIAFIFNPIQNVSAASLADAIANQHESEHNAVMNLVPVEKANRRVVKSGSWSNPSIWSGGKLPAASENLHIPQGMSVLVDVVNDNALGTIRVDGTIKFATNKNVRLKLDTLVVTSTGTFEVGSESARVPAANTVEIVIANKGAIDRKSDPANLGRGIILQGKTRIFGTDKSPFHALATYPDVGATQLRLESTPKGWTKGDIIAVTSTRYRYKQAGDKSYISKDELRKIKSISGNVITLGQVADPNTDDPLLYSHVPTSSNMPVYVANLTRNVAFSGEGGESVPPSQRGHFMAMHSEDVIIKGAGFYYLGRTDKSKPIDDFKLDSRGYRVKDSKGNFIPDKNNNPRGRYAMHFHHTGVSDANKTPAICSGNAVFSSAGWGFVNHTSHVIMENNASYNVYGSHYVSEDGNELGTFKHNIAIKSEGRQSYVKFGQGNHDMGHTGHGFWLESRNMEMEDNVVSGAYKAGIVYWHRNVIPGVDLMIPRANLLTSNKDIVKNLPSIYYEKVPITHEKNSTVLASGEMLTVIKSFPKQDHDARNVIEGLKGYSVLNGISVQYTEKYTFKNIEMVADPGTAKFDGRGINVQPLNKDIVVSNANVEGFIHPVVTGTVFSGKKDQTDVIFVNTRVNGRTIVPANDIHTAANLVVKNYDPNYHKVVNLTQANLVKMASKSQSGLNFIPAATMSTNFPAGFNLGYYFRGTKKDSLGETPYESKWFDKQLLATVHKGYYTDSKKDKFVYLTDLISDRLTGESRQVTVKLKIVSDLSKSLGSSLGAVPQ